MSVQVMLHPGPDVIEEYYLKSNEDIKRLSPGLIKFETEEPGPEKGKKVKRTIIFSGVYSVSFKS